MIKGGLKKSVFHPFFLFSAHLHAAKNKAKLNSYHMTNNFGILYLINLLSCKCVAYCDTTE